MSTSICKFLSNRKVSFLTAWPNKKYVTRQWKTNDDPKSYPQNVRGYPYGSYLNDEVAAIKKLQSAPQSNLPEVDVQGIAVILHPSHPGLLGKKSIYKI
jgi:alpha/beta superfamily hydrolase